MVYIRPDLDGFITMGDVVFYYLLKHHSKLWGTCVRADTARCSGINKSILIDTVAGLGYEYDGSLLTLEERESLSMSHTHI